MHNAPHQWLICKRQLAANLSDLHAIVMWFILLAIDSLLFLYSSISEIRCIACIVQPIQIHCLSSGNCQINRYFSALSIAFSKDPIQSISVIISDHRQM